MIQPSNSRLNTAGSRETRGTQRIYFCLIEFKDVRYDLPEVRSFCHRVAALHRHRQATKFGFHTDIYLGDMIFPAGWYSSWTTFFSELLSRLFQSGKESTGSPWPDYEKLSGAIIKDVIPRLLKPLETAGRSLKPCLVHGNLWEGNTALDLTSGKIVLLGAMAFYAHHEYELGMWRLANLDHSYFKGYFKEFPPSEPAQEWEDRNILYSISFRLRQKSKWLKSQSIRE